MSTILGNIITDESEECQQPVMSDADQKIMDMVNRINELNREENNEENKIATVGSNYQLAMKFYVINDRQTGNNMHIVPANSGGFKDYFSTFQYINHKYMDIYGPLRSFYFCELLHKIFDNRILYGMHPSTQIYENRRAQLLENTSRPEMFVNERIDSIRIQEPWKLKKNSGYVVVVQEENDEDGILEVYKGKGTLYAIYRIN